MRRIKTAQDTSNELMDELDSALLHPKEIFGYGRYGNGTAWLRLDKMTGGLQDRTLGVLAARPKVGKSMLASAWVPYIAYQAMLAGEVVRVVSLEMTRKAYQRRMAAIMAGINDPKNIRRGMLSAEEQDRYRKALVTLSELPIEYLANDSDLLEKDTFKPGGSVITIDDVRSFIRAKNAIPTYWWLLDHIGLLNDIDRYGDVTTSIVVLANKLKDIAHTSATGLVITHLTRGSSGGIPSIDSIAGSDQVGRNADQIFLLHRPFFEAPELSEDDRELIKEGEPAALRFFSRDEGSGVIPLWWRADYATFEEYPEGVDVPMPVTRKKR